MNISEPHPLRLSPHTCELELCECHLQRDAQWKANLLTEYIWQYLETVLTVRIGEWLEVSNTARQPLHRKRPTKEGPVQNAATVEKLCSRCDV